MKHSLKRTLTIFTLVLLTSVFSGCATLFAPKTHPLAVNSDPYGAEVFVNGLRMGVTPLQLSLKADKSYTIEFRKEGYETITSIVNTKVGVGWVVLDVLGGFIPVIIDAATGSWNKLDKDNVHVFLVGK